MGVELSADKPHGPLAPRHGGGWDNDEVFRFGGTHGTLISSTALCSPGNGGADHLAEAKSGGVIKRFKDFGLVEQGRKVFTVDHGQVGREVAVRLLSAGHWTPPFRADGHRQRLQAGERHCPEELLTPSQKGGAALRPRCLMFRAQVRPSTLLRRFATACRKAMFLSSLVRIRANALLA